MVFIIMCAVAYVLVIICAIAQLHDGQTCSGVGYYDSCAGTSTCAQLRS